MRPRIGSLLVLLLVAIVLTTACTTTPAKPSIVISSPPHGSQFHEGEDVAFQSTATDPAGITRVELLINGSTIRTDSSPSPQGQASFTLIQTWKASPGTHTVAIRAYNSTNAMSDPAVISISVLSAAATATTTLPATAPAATPTNTATPIIVPATVPPTAATVPTPVPPPATISGACTNNAAFVADVTMPDGTALMPGQTFNKIWRVRNTGTCTWNSTYDFAYVGGESFTTSTFIAVPSTAPGATADLLVAMAAPAAPGLHSSQWRLRSTTDAYFGTTLTVVVNVLGAAPETPPTAIPPTAVPPQATGCTGAPAISSFTASAASITKGNSVTLNWGAVNNADAVEIDNGVGGIGTPGSVSLTPTSTTTYTLTAHCGANIATRQVAVTVLQPLVPITLVPIKPIIPILLFKVTAANIAMTKSCSGWPLKTGIFSGSIVTNGTGSVQGQWVDTSNGHTQAINANSTGTNIPIVTFYTHNGSQNGSVYIEITKPNTFESNKINFTCN